jgi:hypothetical protein
MQPVYHLIKARTVNKCGTDKGKAKKKLFNNPVPKLFSVRSKVPFVNEKVSPIFCF